MQVFEDISKYSTIILIVGAILFVLGFLLKGNAKKSTGTAVVSTLFLTLGSGLLILALFKWISDSLGNWGFFSDRML